MQSFFLLHKDEKIEDTTNNMEKIKKISIGLIAGFICGIFASGGGLILLPAFIYLLKMEEKEARMTTIWCVVPLVLATFFIYSQNNLVDWKIGIMCAIGGILGGSIGAKLLKKLPNLWLKIILLVLILYSAIRMIR